MDVINNIGRSLKNSRRKICLSFTNNGQK